ncbi:hypothetical protein CsSME_00026035 [Camellia sinensis var. sinensis]
MGLYLGPRLYMKPQKRQDREYEVGDHVFVKSARAREFTLERGSKAHAPAEVEYPSSVNIMQLVLFMSLHPAQAKKVRLERSFIVCMSARA